MPSCNQEISTFQLEFEHILELEVNLNHDPKFIKRNILTDKSLTPIDIPSMLIIFTSREIIIVMTIFVITNSLTLDNSK